jgi:hypothetical protein
MAFCAVAADVPASDTDVDELAVTGSIRPDPVATPEPSGVSTARKSPSATSSELQDADLLIAGTFDVLEQGGALMQVASTTDVPKRKVRSVAVRPNGQPILPPEEPDSAIQPASPQPISASVAPVPAPRPKFASAEANDPAPAASFDGNTRTVKGMGVNVRSAPTSAGGKLFALKGGEKVTVIETKRGWVRVTDSRGRSGWAYKDYLS